MEYLLITQAVRPGLKFRLSFFFFPRSVTNRRPGSKAHARNLRMRKEGQLSTWEAILVPRALVSFGHVVSETKGSGSSHNRMS